VRIISPPNVRMSDSARVSYIGKRYIVGAKNPTGLNSGYKVGLYLELWLVNTN